MHALLRSMTARLLLAAAGSALVALFVFVVNPFPSDVYGQPAPGSTLPSAATVPVAERTTTTAPETTAPAANTSTAPATTDPASAAASTTTSPVTSTTTSPATNSAAAAPIVSAAQQVAVAQQPVALPRTGTGLDADTDMSTGVAYGFLALAAALGTAAVVHRARRAR